MPVFEQFALSRGCFMLVKRAPERGSVPIRTEGYSSPICEKSFLSWLRGRKWTSPGSSLESHH